MLLTVQRVRSLLLRVMSDPRSVLVTLPVVYCGQLSNVFYLSSSSSTPSCKWRISKSIQSLLILLSAIIPITNQTRSSILFQLLFKKDKDRYCFWFFTSLLRCSQDQIGKWHVKPLKSSSAEEKVTKEVLVHFYRVHHQWLRSFVMRSTYFF